MTLSTGTEPTSVDAPTHSDEFVRGLSEAVGGPVGTHAAATPPNRFWTATRVVLALVCLTLSLHWVQKSPCQDGAWTDYKQYRLMCYTDVLALYYAEGLSDGKVPYRDHPVEYPVLTGAFMGALGLPIHALGTNRSGINQGEWFWNANVVVLGAIAIASVAAMLALRRRRPWDVAMFAASPALFVTATVNWDLLAVGFAVFGMLAWARKKPVLAGVLLGLGTAAKLWPGFLFIPLLLLALRARKFGTAVLCGAVGVVTWLVVNLPIAFAYTELLGDVLQPQLDATDRLGHPLVPGRALPVRGFAARLRQPAGPDPGHQQAAVRAVRVVLPADRVVDLHGSAPATVRSGGVPGGRRVPGLLQGLVTAVRAVAAAARGTRPAPVGRLPGLAGRGGLLLLRVLRRTAQRLGQDRLSGVAVRPRRPGPPGHRVRAGRVRGPRRAAARAGRGTPDL